MAQLTHFLSNVRNQVIAQDGGQLGILFQVEPAKRNKAYGQLRSELRQSYSSSNTAALDNFVEKCLPEDNDPSPERGTPWPSFVAFVKEYVRYWRNVNFENLLDVHETLETLVTSCATALSHPTHGVILLETSVSLCESLSKVVMMLNRHPRVLRARRVASGDEDGKSMVEHSADIIQKCFVSCLTDRTTVRFDRPQGKKVGVYVFANLVLKLLLTCGKSRLSSQLLLNISTSGPPLSFYPAAQRITYLYFLGRFNFDCDQFLRASQCLEAAYLHTPAHFTKHRRLILTHLIPCNLMLGRLPRELLLQRPEAASTLAPRFRPLMQAIRKGDFLLFQQTLARHEAWFYARGLLLALTYRLRPIIWRSLLRRVFLLTYNTANAAAEQSRAAATLSLADALVAASYVQDCLVATLPRIQGAIAFSTPAAHKPAAQIRNPVLMTALSKSTARASASASARASANELMPSQGLFCGSMPPTTHQIEGVVAALVSQGLMHGFVAHSSGRFAIMGAKQRGGPLAAGWPVVWGVILERMREDGIDVREVTGWVKAPQ